MSERPAWDDEQFAGSLFPRAMAQKPRRIIARDFSGTPLVIAPAKAMHAHHDRKEASRDALRRQEETPEGHEARWQAERQRARAAIRRERRQERILAGLKTGAISGIDIADLERFKATYAAAATEIGAQLDPFMAAMRGVAEAIAGIGPALVKATAQMEREAARQRAINQVMAAPPPSSRIDVERLVRDFAATSVAPAPKPQPPRDRYLPGTRHARKGQR